jgi:hypothetical protein
VGSSKKAANPVQFSGEAAFLFTNVAISPLEALLDKAL